MIVDVLSNNEYEEHPTQARITFNEQSLNRIFQLHEALVSVEAYSITISFGVDEWLIEDYNDEDEAVYVTWDERYENTKIIVLNDSVVIMSYKKNGSSFETEFIMLSELQEIYKVLKSPVEDLPLFIETLKSEEAKAILQERLSQ